MIRSAALAALVFCLGSAGASAQTTKAAPATTPAPAAVPAAPERTTASFGDWVMRCETAAEPVRRVCEVALVITAQGQAAPIAQLALGKQAPTEPRRITVVLPPNVALLSRPQVMIPKAGAARIELTWQRCTPGACFASAPIADDVVASFAGQTEPGRIVFKDAADRDVALPMSFRGLSQALAALAKES